MSRRSIGRQRWTSTFHQCLAYPRLLSHGVTYHNEHRHQHPAWVRPRVDHHRNKVGRHPHDGHQAHRLENADHLEGGTERAELVHHFAKVRNESTGCILQCYQQVERRRRKDRNDNHSRYVLEIWQRLIRTQRDDMPLLTTPAESRTSCCWRIERCCFIMIKVVVAFVNSSIIVAEPCSRYIVSK